MKLYEINEELEKLIDRDTGEVADADAFALLSLEREVKLENIALMIKNDESDAAALKAEERALAERRMSAENRAERLRGYLAAMLGDGEKFETSRVRLSWRKSKSVQLLIPESDFVRWAKEVKPELLTYKEPSVSKSAIREAIEAGEEIIAATIVENSNLQIK